MSTVHHEGSSVRREGSRVHGPGPVFPLVFHVLVRPGNCTLNKVQKLKEKKKIEG